MIEFPCQVCRTPLQASDGQAGQLVRCPTCLTALRVPTPQTTSPSAPSSATSGASTAPTRPLPKPPPSPRSTRGVSEVARQSSSPGKRYGFNCPYCSSRLEATDAMAAQDGQCPTCGSNITIPILDRYGRLIDPKTRQIIKPDPHPVHAYAAAGDRAPRIIRDENHQQFIQCPRCSSASLISANNCKGCGMPFTMDGTTLEAAGTSNGFCVASLVLGIIGMPCGMTLILPALAIILGIIGYNQAAKGEGGGKGMAIAGMVFGGIGGIIGFNVLM